MPADARSLSIIVPVLNEAGLIRSFLDTLRQRVPDAEIIVVDGGSCDATAEIARERCDRLILAKRGRGAQMNAGARVAAANTLWFLHADTKVPRGCADEIASALRDKRTVGGYFRVRLPRDRVIYRLTDSFAHYAGNILRVRCGDHGFFCRRKVFQKIGGFPEQPLMEDVEFFRALKRSGRVRSIGLRLKLSARRYEEIGPAKLTVAYGLIATLYALGLPLRTLDWIYRRTCFRFVSEPPFAAPLPNTCGWRSSAASRSRSS